MLKLEAARAIVDQLQVYKTEPVDLQGNAVAADFRSRGADAILFASSSSAQSFAAQAALKLAPGAKKPVAGSIGPQTSAAMKAAGIKVDFEAATPGLAELIAALVKKLS